MSEKRLLWAPLSNTDQPPVYVTGLRDQFAAAALTGLLATGHYAQHMDVAVADAYRLADAMLAEREEGGGDE